MNPTVLVSRRWPATVEASLARQFKATFNSADVPLSAEYFRDALFQYDAILPTVTDKLDSSVFDGVSRDKVRTRIIGNYGVGFSHIDIDQAKSLGIVVTNTPDVLSECTADIAMMLMLMVARRAGEGERELRANQWTGWRPTHLVGSRVSGKTLGIVGFGRIGREAAKRARGFNMRVCVHNRSRIDDAVLSTCGATQCESLDELVGSADFISLHCPGGEQNKHLIDASIIEQMKPSAFLINTARGEVVDEAALIQALQSKRIAGAGLDVFNNEPAINSAFHRLENAVLLPHLGSATDETRTAMGERVVENISAFFDGHEAPDRIA